jgi:hypothetical protein
MQVGLLVCIFILIFTPVCIYSDATVSESIISGEYHTPICT